MFRRRESLQAAFTLVFGERLHTARRKIRETTIQRGERLGVERRPVVIRAVAEILEPHLREFSLRFGQLIRKLVQRFASRPLLNSRGSETGAAQ